MSFFTVGVFVPISCLALLFMAKKMHLLLPFPDVIAGYFLKHMLHEDPSGFEWQNHRLLKLYPVIFADVGLVLDRSKIVSA